MEPSTWRIVKHGWLVYGPKRRRGSCWKQRLPKLKLISFYHCVSEFWNQLGGGGKAPVLVLRTVRVMHTVHWEPDKNLLVTTCDMVTVPQTLNSCLLWLNHMLSWPLSRSYPCWQQNGNVLCSVPVPGQHLSLICFSNLVVCKHCLQLLRKIRSVNRCKWFSKAISTTCSCFQWESSDLTQSLVMLSQTSKLISGRRYTMHRKRFITRTGLSSQSWCACDGFYTLPTKARF